jgi:hypothetical protein
LSQVVDYIIYEAEVQEPVYVTGMPHPESLFGCFAGAAVSPYCLSERDLGIHENIPFRLIHKRIIIAVEEFVGIAHPVEKTDLIKRKAIIPKCRIDRRITVGEPVPVKERKDSIKRHGHFFGEI